MHLGSLWLLSGYEEIFAKELPVWGFLSLAFSWSFRRLVPAWVDQGHDVVFLSKSIEWHAPKVDGYRLIGYKPHRPGGGSYQHPYLRRLEPAIIEGQAAYRAAQQLKNEGWYPDVIINHVGFGNGLFLGSLFPNAKKIGLFEWYYNAFVRC